MCGSRSLENHPGSQPLGRTASWKSVDLLAEKLYLHRIPDCAAAGLRPKLQSLRAVQQAAGA
jgi:hypothetical protein